MSGFSVNVPAAEVVSADINSLPFWPAIDPNELREQQRIDSAITEVRLRVALVEAIAWANQELRPWRLEREGAGVERLDDIDAEEVDGQSVLVHRYRWAVGCMAKAILTERYRDIDITVTGDRRADVLDNPIDQLRRDAQWAIADIRGAGRAIVELI